MLQSGVTNYLVVALDEDLRDLMISKGINVYYYEVALHPNARLKLKPSFASNTNCCSDK